MQFDSVGVTEKRPSRFPNEIAKTAQNLPL